MQFNSKLKKLYREKVVLDAMAADSIDVSDELAAIEEKMVAIKKMAEKLEVIDYYKKRTRWKSGNDLTDAQKDKIRELKELHSRTIAEEVFAE
tara:strand:- start:253 stop:531 length:279 start_codon:yes stop_codon:yes gene_type:complete